MKLARNYGDGGDLNPQFSGLNARLSEFNAILGIETLEYLEKNIQRRNELANLYKRKLSNFGVKFQKISNFTEFFNCWNLFCNIFNVFKFS